MKLNFLLNALPTEKGDTEKAVMCSTFHNEIISLSLIYIYDGCLTKFIDFVKSIELFFVNVVICAGISKLNIYENEEELFVLGKYLCKVLFHAYETHFHSCMLV